MRSGSCPFALGCQKTLTTVLMTGARPKMSGAMYSLYVAGGRPVAFAASMADLVAKMTQMAPMAPAAPAMAENDRPVVEGPGRSALGGGSRKRAAGKTPRDRKDVAEG